MTRTSCLMEEAGVPAAWVVSSPTSSRHAGRYRDTAVLVRSLEPYHDAIRRVFARNEIPFFLDRREPVGHHPLAELTRSVLLDEQTLSRGYFRPEVVRRYVEEHLEGRFDHAYRLWALLFFELWHRRWLDQRSWPG